MVDGCVRDVEDIRREKFPVYCRGITPAGPHKGWADSVNVPIQCGGIPVCPGDLVVGDDDGVVVIPRQEVPAVYDDVCTKIKQEEQWLAMIEAGETSLKAVGLESVLGHMDVEFVDD